MESQKWGREANRYSEEGAEWTAEAVWGSASEDTRESQACIWLVTHNQLHIGFHRPIGLKLRRKFRNALSFFKQWKFRKCSLIFQAVNGQHHLSSWRRRMAHFAYVWTFNDWAPKPELMHTQCLGSEISSWCQVYHNPRPGEDLLAGYCRRGGPITTLCGQFEFKGNSVLSPRAQQHSGVLWTRYWKNVDHAYDDLNILSNTWEEHKCHLSTIL